MKKQNTIFLFGAGAVIDWGGPSTPELTQIIREEGFSIKGSNQKLTDYIYETLIYNGFDKNEINFETILGVIEELSIYFSEFDSDKQTPSLLRNFLNNDIEKILDFSITEDKRKHGYRLNIPEDKEYPFSNYAYNKENPTQFYLQHLISELNSKISTVVYEYSYHTKSHSLIELESKNSQNFVKWISRFSAKNNLRLYTLNYDRLFKVLLEYANIDCFEGFYPSGEVSDMDGLRCDLKRITKDDYSNIHYNLHGSLFWKVKPLNQSQLPSPELVYAGPNISVNDEIVNVQIEKGKPIYLTNIISGYQKAQKSMLSPFKQMHFSFDRDCLSSNQILIVGYSFSDEHINQCLKTAFRYNEKLQVEIIEPNFFENKIYDYVLINMLSYIETDYLDGEQTGQNEFKYYNGRITVYTLKFNEYLELKVNTGQF